MARKKVKLAFISNDTARKASYNKRKKGLMKKVSELSTLCGVAACAIIYSPYEDKPEAWPSEAGAGRVLERLRDRPEAEQRGRMVDQESFLMQRIAKLSDQLEKQKKANKDKEVSLVMRRLWSGDMSFNDLEPQDLSDLKSFLDKEKKREFGN